VRDFTLWERLLTQPRVLLDYLGSILLPSMQVGIFYDDYEISRGLLTPWTTLPSVLIVLGGLVSAWLVRTRFPLAAFAVFWFVAGHLIESTVIPLELYFEHRNYLAMLGPVLAVLIALFRSGGDLKIPLRAAAISWIALTAFVGHQAAKTWGDELTHAEMWAIERPNSTRAVQQLASAHVKIGFFDAASRILQRGIKRLPEATELEFQHALLECISGDATDGTFDRLTEIAQTAPWARIIPDVMSELRRRAASRQCGGALSPADYRDLTMALLANPHFQNRTESVGYLYNELGMLYLDIGQPANALEPFRRSFEARRDPQVALNEANIAIFLGQFKRAESALKRAREVSRPAFQEWLHPLDERLAQVRKRLERTRTDDAPEPQG
jgi:tetratricopeptide (TPR) repeat protein